MLRRSKFFLESPWAPGHWPFHVCIDAHGQRVGIIHLSAKWTRFHSEWVNEVKTALWNLPAPQRQCICWFCSRLRVHRQHCAWDLSSFQKKKLLSSPINPVWSILVLSLIGSFPQGSGWKFKKIYELSPPIVLDSRLIDLLAQNSNCKPSKQTHKLVSFKSLKRSWSSKISCFSFSGCFSEVIASHSSWKHKAQWRNIRSYYEVVCFACLSSTFDQ